MVVASDRIHADDTPIQVLDPRKKRIEGLARGVKEGRIWVYVRDDRPWAGSDPPAAAYWFSPDRKGEQWSTLEVLVNQLEQSRMGGFQRQDFVAICKTGCVFLVVGRGWFLRHGAKYISTVGLGSEPNQGIARQPLT